MCAENIPFCMKNTLLYISKEVYIDLRELLQVGRVIENDRGEMGIILPDRIIYFITLAVT